MAGFMNAELIAIKENLVCGQCQKRFIGSDSQARKVKYEQRVVYCSPKCRKEAAQKRGQKQAIKEGKKLRKGILVGPCPVCNKMFESSYNKTFCSLECYNKSPQFKQMLQDNYQKGNKATQDIWDVKMKRKCIVCGKIYRAKRSKQKYCSLTCHRQFKADLFDAWVNNPQKIMMPSGYDEFLLQDELPCLVEGCSWTGKHLSVHLNVVHGIKAEDFKKEAGFNLKTGLVVNELHEKMVERPHVGVACDPSLQCKGQEVIAVHGIKRNDYKSEEGKIHQKQARMIKSIDPGPIRKCVGCGKEFQQSTPFGRAKYCTTSCRNSYYSVLQKRKSKKRTRNSDGFIGSTKE